MKLYDENTGQQFKNMFSDYTKTRRDMTRVKFWTLLFFIPIIIANWIAGRAKDNADLLGGKKTIESFFSANVIALTILVLTAICFIVYVSKTWKGKEGTSIGTVMVYIFVLIGLTAFICIRLGALSNIREDMNSPREVKLKTYITCTNQSRDRFVVFEDGGEEILLQIPEGKYDELLMKEEGKKSDVSLTLSLVEDADYDDIEVKTGKITVKYYKHSVIYENMTV